MTGSASKPQNPEAASAAGGQTLGGQIRAIILIFRRSRELSVFKGLCLGLIVVVGATAYLQIELNAWNEPFYDSINRRDVSGFMHQLLVFAGIAGALLILNVAQTWLNQMMKLKLRESLTRDLLAQWLMPKRAFLLAGAGEIGVNPDQRIHEDARRLTEVSTDLGIGLFQATLLLVSFIGVLWTLSGGVTFEVSGARFALPGYMVWCALLYSALASAASWRVGRPLVDLNAERYARESDLRFALVHANEHSEGVAVYRGEAEEEAVLNRTFDRLLVNLRLLVGATTRLTWVVAGYGWFTIVAPTIIAAPAYFTGTLTLGGLLMAVGAFTQVQQSLRWFVDNSGLIADWRATLQRVCVFRAALADTDTIGEQSSRIELRAGTEDRLVLDHVRIYTPSGSTSLTPAHVEIAPGEHVLIVGDPGSGKNSLFRALAGLWPWGEGAIILPPAANMMFLPKRPFLSDGHLRDVLAYPGARDRFSDQEYRAVLMDLGLDHLVAALDRAARWDRDLTEVEQQSVAFARILLHKPRWAIVDAALETLPAQTKQRLFDVLGRQSPTMSLISIGGRDAKDTFFKRIVSLERNPEGRRIEHLRFERQPRGRFHL